MPDETIPLTDPGITHEPATAEPATAEPATAEPATHETATTAPSDEGKFWIADRIVEPVAQTVGRIGGWLARTLHGANRPFYGVEVGGILAGYGAQEGVARLSDGHARRAAQAEPTGPTVPQETPIAPEGTSYFDDRVRATMKKPRVQRRFGNIMTHHAVQPVVLGQSETRLEYSQRIFRNTHLPEGLKRVLPFVPFQESDYRLNAHSPAGADGPWQFMSGAGRKYGLVSGKKGKSGYRDNRRDFVRSTQAAAEYFQDIYTSLRDDPHYKMLKDRYGLSEDDFLVPATINAFNAGEELIKHAMKIMATEPSILDEVTAHARSGPRGLFSYMTDVYIHDFKKWQKPVFKPPYYHRESAAYVYGIEAFYRLHAQTAAQATAVATGPAAAPPKENGDPTAKAGGPRETSLKSATIFGAAAATVLYAGSQVIVDQTRRRFFTTLGATVACAMGGGAGGALNLVLHEDDRGKGEGEEKISEKKESLHRIDHRVGLLLYANKLDDVRAQARYPEDKPGLYSYNQKMGDVAFELYSRTGDSDYLVLSEYFYRHALELAQRQQEGRYALPGGGISKVMERIRYCEAAHSLVSSEF